MERSAGGEPEEDHAVREGRERRRHRPAGQRRARGLVGERRRRRNSGIRLGRGAHVFGLEPFYVDGESPREALKSILTIIFNFNRQ
jgi:hypothetical protein